MEAASLGFLAPLMFLGLVVFLLLGYPVAFALAANGLLFAGIGIAAGISTLAAARAARTRLRHRRQSRCSASPLAFYGLILERSRHG
jgi:TRAP-type mannitol/chloroaromatic compound transport system permease large subunit